MRQMAHARAPSVSRPLSEKARARSLTHADRNRFRERASTTVAALTHCTALYVLAPDRRLLQHSLALTVRRL